MFRNLTYPQSKLTCQIGKKGYELSNHLGNVLSVISDKAIPHDNGGGVVDYFLADILQAQDYSPFGVLLQNRNFKKTGLIDKFRFGFQNQEMDDEVKGEGNSVNYTFRMHDPRLGRFFAIDPLTAKYPFYTPYSFSGNKVIAFVELEGAEEKNATNDATKRTCVFIVIMSSEELEKFYSGNKPINKGDVPITSYPMGQFQLFFATSIENATKQVQEYLGPEVKIEAIVITAHANSQGVRVDYNPKGTEDGRIKTDEVKAFFEAKDDEWNCSVDDPESLTFDKQLGDIKTLADLVKPGGVFVFNSCNLGDNPEFGQMISTINPEIDFYFNRDKSGFYSIGGRAQIYNGTKSLSYCDDILGNICEGWMKVNDYQINILKNVEGKTGGLYIDTRYNKTAINEQVE